MSIFRQKQARILRIVRKIHRIFGIWLFLFLFVTGATGLLLGWKKNSFGLILAETTSGVSRDVQGFLLLDTIISISENHARLHFQNGEHEIDRIEVRPDKGIVKVNFKNNYKGLQIDATNGKILKVESRNSDLIEHIHDGSWFDRTFGPKLIRRHHEE